jgi:OmpA-OmpF porin, OOP family
MKLKKLYCLFILTCLSIDIYSQSIVTAQPEIGEKNTREAHIDKIELNAKYSIVYMSFSLRPGNNGSSPSPKTLEDMLDILRNGGRRGSSHNFISISPKSYLANSRTGKKYKYIKASGIPEEPEQLDVHAGQKVNFKVYYQRVDPGVTLIDFFEGDNNERVRYWNFNHIKINNPAALEQVEAVKETDVAAAKSIENGLILLKGRILDVKTGKPVAARIDVKRSENPLILDSTLAFPSTGSYKTQLPSTGSYQLVVTAVGYLVATQNLEAKNAGVFEKDVLLKPIVAGEVVLLESVYFETAQYDLLASAHNELDIIVLWLQNNPNLRIVLEGHTDIVGDQDSNQKLSEQRVAAVKNYLIAKGIVNNRIETKGYGSTKPLNTNGTIEERSKNRRVEFRILST